MLAVEQLTEQERATIRCALELCLHHWQDGLAILLDGGTLKAFETYVKEGASMLAELNAKDIPTF